MKYYFTLQFLRAKRWMVENGVHPVLGLVSAMIIYFVASKYLFYRFELAPWVYLGMAILLISGFGSKFRNRQLSLIFDGMAYRKIKLAENILVALPFSIFMICEQHVLQALVLLVSAVLLAIIQVEYRFSKVIPTPFRKYPFESIIGFRRTFFFIIVLYLILAKAIQIDNFNLGMVTLGFLYLIMLSYYYKPESRYFVWIFSDTAKSFLSKKIWSSSICASMVALPVVIILILVYPSYWYIPVVISLVGNVFIIATILAKYSVFPKEMNVPQALLLGLSIWMPPILLLTLPLFYRKSIKNLDQILI